MTKAATKKSAASGRKTAPGRRPASRSTSVAEVATSAIEQTQRLANEFIYQCGEPMTKEDLVRVFDRLESPSFSDHPSLEKIRTNSLYGKLGPCVCGHSMEEHGHDPKYPGSTACNADLPEKCRCIAYEAEDGDAD